MEDYVIGTTTPLGCQRALMREIERITADMRFQSADGGSDAKLTAYEQTLPLPERITHLIGGETDTIDFTAEEVEDAIQKFPWVKVRIREVYTEKPNRNQMVVFELNCGFYRATKERDGHREVLNVYQKIYERFMKDPILDNQYVNNGEWSLTIEEDDVWPYYYGYITTTFDVRGIMNERKW